MEEKLLNTNISVLKILSFEKNITKYASRYTAGRKIYCKCHFLLSITANYCNCTVSAVNYCRLQSLLLSVLRITVIFCAFYGQCCHLLSLYCRYCELLSFTSLSIASREPWNCASGWLHKVGRLFKKEYLFLKINSSKFSAYSFWASWDDCNDTKHYMCILEY